MATHGATKARRIGINAAGVIGIELLTATQGIDFHAPLRTSPTLDRAVRAIRSRFPHYQSDRYLADELGWAKEAVLSGDFSSLLEADLF